MNDIIRYIPFGANNAISRLELMKDSGLSERTIREKIKQANFALTKRGQAIIATSKRNGYWISDNIAELKAYVKEAERRSKNLRKNNKPIYDLIRRLSNQ